MPYMPLFGVLNQETTPTVKTSTPTINTPILAPTWKYTVKNNDDSYATIYSDYNGTNPAETSRGSVAPDANSGTINTGSTFGGFTIYANAQADGELMSDTDSYYVS